MRGLALACVASLLLYATTFAFLLDRPLSLGMPHAQLDAAIARGAAIEGRKLVILAGSNGPYSHRCAAIEPLVGMACVNAGVAVGIGLDYLFARWKPLLHPGDIVYLPLEEAQYTVSEAANRLGPDAAIMARHDWTTLSRLPPDRWVAAFFAFDLRAAIMSAIETALVAGRFHDPRAEAGGTLNAWGDHIGHTALKAAANRLMLASVRPEHATAQQVASQAASHHLPVFLDWAAAHGVRAVGGLPTGFADSPMPPETLAAIQALFEAHGAGFLMLANRSRYNRGDFFDTADHLHETAQIAHSQAIGRMLRQAAGEAIAAAESPRRR